MNDTEPLSFGFDPSELKMPALLKALGEALAPIARLPVATMASPVFWTEAAEGLAKMVVQHARVRAADVLVGAWKTHKKFHKYADKTKFPPEREERVPLLSHHIISRHKPYIEIFIDGHSQGKIAFELELDVAIDTGTVVVKNGYLTAIEGGKVKYTAKLKCGGTTMAEKASKPDEWRSRVSLGEPGILIAAPALPA